MSKHKSISQRLRCAKSAETKQEVAQDWATNWHQDQFKVFKLLEAALKADDYDQLCIGVGQLKAVTEKRFAALPNVLKELAKKEE